MEGEDTRVAFLDRQAPLLFRCSRQVSLMSASFGEVGDRGFMKSGLGVEEKGDSGMWLVSSAEGWGGAFHGSQAAAEQVSNPDLPLVLFHCTLSLQESA